METILVTGAAGFIGMHAARRILEAGGAVVGVDNLNDYYAPSLKEARLAELRRYPKFLFLRADLSEQERTAELFAKHAFDRVVHLAAQAGVRHSVEHPQAYIESNIRAFLHILEGCRSGGVKHLVFASSSSVYGGNARVPFSASGPADHPLNLYAATKRANELMAHAYSHLYRFPSTGLRFFTVYGPWGRPDMSYFKFAKAIADGRPIDLYNCGRMQRDFTFIDDIVEALYCILSKPPSAVAGSAEMGPSRSRVAPFRVFNLGNNKPVPLLRMVQLIEQCMNRQAEKKFLPMQPGDAEITFADTDELIAEIGFQPHTPIESGIARFVEWFRGYYGEKRAAA